MILLDYAKKLVQKHRAKRLKKCGAHVYIDKTAQLLGNIEVGDHVTIGAGDRFVSTGAKLIIESNVVFGPDVSIYTGDHATDILGYHICEITDEHKKAHGGKYDSDVKIESGCWIGTRAIILKGCTIGRGSIIGAGAVVVKDVPPYSVYVGVPGARVFPRFTDAQIVEHEALLASRGMLP